MNLVLHDVAAPGGDLQRVLCALAGEIKSLLREPVQPSPNRIHDIRVDAKKLRSLLKLGEGRVGPSIRKEAVALARTIKESFASTRDDEVMREALAGLLPTIKPEELNILEASAATETSSDILAAADRLGELMQGLDFRDLSAKKVLTNWLRSYRIARKIRKECRNDADNLLWHTWRKRIKDLFYQTCALENVVVLQPLLSPLEALADLLGQNHDLAILKGRLSREMAGSKAEKKLRRRKKKIMRQSLDIAARCLDKKASTMRGKLL